MHTIKVAEDNKEKNYRQLNHIIHGVSNLINGDEFVKELFSIHLKTDIKPSSIKRIGSPGINNSNLIRIRYTSYTDKAQISSSLKLLKTAPSKFKKIRIADDLTFEDQIKLRKLRDEATELNNANEDSTLKHVVHYNRISKNHYITTIKVPDKPVQSEQSSETITVQANQSEQTHKPAQSEEQERKSETTARN